MNVWNEPVTEIEGWAWIVIGISSICLIQIFFIRRQNFDAKDRAVINSLTNGI